MYNFMYRFQGQKRVLVIALDSSTSLSLSGALSVCSLLSLPVSLHIPLSGILQLKYNVLLYSCNSLRAVLKFLSSYESSLAIFLCKNFCSVYESSFTMFSFVHTLVHAHVHTYTLFIHSSSREGGYQQGEIKWSISPLGLLPGQDSE